MKKIFLTHILSVVALFVAQAQMPVDSIVADIRHMAQWQESHTVAECDSVAHEWVESIARQDLFTYASQAQKILFPPYSTQKGRIAFRRLLERLLQSGEDEYALMRYRYMYESLCVNNEGDEATDFIYYDADGNEHTLRSHRGHKTLIIFNDPECEECAALRRYLAEHGELQGVPIDSATTVLVIYPDEPTDAWRSAVAHYPAEWIVGYSEDVSDLYDLRTLPSTYLLDDNHVILLRDAHSYITAAH